MKQLRLLIALPISLTISIANAQTGEFFIGPDIGRSELKVSDSYSIVDDSDKVYGTKAGVIFGYHWASNFIIEAGLSNTTSDSFFGAFDDYRLYEVRASLGYSIELGEHFRLVPMIGLTEWDLDSKEGQLFNPGKEDEVNVDGTDVTYKLNMEVPVNDLVLLYLSYSNSEYDFGDVESATFGAKFEF